MAIERARGALNKINPLLYLSHGGYSILSPEVQETPQEVLQRTENIKHTKLFATGAATVGSFALGVTETVAAINTNGTEASDHAFKGMVALGAAVVFRAAMEKYTDTKSELTPSEKILEAIDFLEEAASPDQILEEVKRKHPSRLNVMYLPKWDKALSQLVSSGKIVSIPNPEDEVDHDEHRLYRRATERNRRNDLSRTY